MISERVFGKTSDGREVKEFILDNGVIEAHILNYGCIIRNLFVPENGGRRDVVLGYDDVAGYENYGGYLGAFVGRVANRIKDAKFSLNGKTYRLFANDNKNCLHGGKIGFDKKIYDVTVSGDDKLILTAISPNGEEGFPGNMKISVTYCLNGSKLDIHYECECDQDTPISLTNHSYFNLSGEDTVLEHILTINADHITPIDKSLIPTGELMFVEDTPFDFRKGQKIGLYINYPHKQLVNGGGYDHNFVLKNYGKYEKVASLYSPISKINVDVYTDNFGIQIYSGNFLDGVTGKNGRVHNRRSAICLETQNFPNSVNQPSFPSAILKAGEKFCRNTSYSFSLKN